MNEPGPRPPWMRPEPPNIQNSAGFYAENHGNFRSPPVPHSGHGSRMPGNNAFHPYQKNSQGGFIRTPSAGGLHAGPYNEKGPPVMGGGPKPQNLPPYPSPDTTKPPPTNIMPHLPPMNQPPPPFTMPGAQYGPSAPRGPMLSEPNVHSGPLSTGGMNFGQKRHECQPGFHGNSQQGQMMVPPPTLHPPNQGQLPPSQPPPPHQFQPLHGHRQHNQPPSQFMPPQQPSQQMPPPNFPPQNQYIPSPRATGPVITEPPGGGYSVPFHPGPRRQDSSPASVLNSTELSNERKAVSRDAQWLADWLKNKQLHNKVTHAQDSEKCISIPEYKDLLRQSLQLMTDLKTLTQELKANVTEDEAWQTKSKLAVDVQAQLDSVLSRLSNDNLLKQVQTKLKRSTSKRARLKRQRKEQFTEKMEVAQKREELHRMIDSQRDAIQQQVDNDKREKEIKAAADSILGEVRRKLNETNRRLEIATALQKLRQLRKTSAERKGLYTSIDSDHKFESGMEKMVDLLNKQKAIYEREQQTLQVMSEIEQEETREKDRQDAEKQTAYKQRQRERKIQHWLFGKPVGSDEKEPLYPYRQFYLQGEQNQDSLIHIRREWDQYLVPPGTMGSSKIPTGWVTPSEPSSDVWASALTEHQQIH